MKTFYTYSFGCRVNEAEREEIDRKMALSGFRFEAKKPDIFIINTCSVTHKAEREARQLIYQTRKKLPKAKIVITGCSATYWIKNSLYKQLPVDMMIDNVNKEFLVDLVKKRLNLATMHPRGGRGITNKFIGSGRVMIKIQDGCQQYCTFCIVPYLRGIPKSERIKNIELRIKNFEGDTSEVILSAINTQAFGYDTKESFVELLKGVIDNTSIPRISLGSIHPWSLADDFYEFYKEYFPKNRLVNFFHVPVQSGSNKILNLMKRGYTREEMMEKLTSIKRLNELAFIGTDIITGFLEESNKDFEDTYNFLKESPINKFHVFRFSKRSKTAADYMAKRLKEPSAEEKVKRAKALAELSREKYEKFLAQNVGRTSSVLLLQKAVEGFQKGLLDNQLPILIFATGRLTPTRCIEMAKVIEFKNGKLFGRII